MIAYKDVMMLVRGSLQCMATIGGVEEYEAVRQFMQSLPAAKFTCSQYSILNRPTAPICMLVHVR